MWPFDRHRHQWGKWELADAEKSLPWSAPRAIKVQVRHYVDCNYMDWREL